MALGNKTPLEYALLQCLCPDQGDHGRRKLRHNDAVVAQQVRGLMTKRCLRRNEFVLALFPDVAPVL
jgi:hypothetical protein